MNALIKKEITRTLSIKELRHVIPNYVRVAKYDLLRNKKTLKECLGGATVLILLFNIHDKKHQVLNQPGHFFCISVRGPEKCVVFSSTGMKPKKELFITHSDPTLLERILPAGTTYNNVSFQTSRDSNTCWRWLFLFAHLCPLGLPKFQSLFSRPNLHITDPDFLATLCTYPLLF